MSATCQSPLCGKRIGDVPTGAWRRTPRRFCSNSCQQDVWALRRVAELLLPLGQVAAWEILKKLENGGSPGKGEGEGEIIDPGAN